MELRVYNTLRSKVEPFVPRNGKKVLMYVCGPTVYDYSHIGHARTYLAFDVIVRFMRYLGYDVKYIVNITNIDDKIIRQAKKTMEDPLELADRFEKSFFDNMRSLGISNADDYPRVTDHILEIISLVEKLIAKGFAYVVKGNVFFNVEKAEGYGKLSHQSLDMIKAGTRIGIDVRKRNPADFALWKRSKGGEPSWESPWGQGRPGWHIECSAISMKYLGDQIDIHGGGRDLIFPHHENEIAQSEAFSGNQPFVKYWLHMGFLTINGEKMSKSLGNYITIDDLLEKYDPEVFRLFILSTHYRRPINFNERALEHSKKSLDRIYNAVDNLRMEIKNSTDYEHDAKDTLLLENLKEVRTKIIEAMSNDFDTPRALAEFFDLVHLANKAIRDQEGKLVLEAILEAVNEFSKIFGILKKREEREIPGNIKKLIKEREFARKNKNWAIADRIRSELREIGILLEDYDGETRWKYERQD